MDGVVGASPSSARAVNKTIAHVATTFLVVGLAMVAGTAYWVLHTGQLARGAQRAPGTVIELERSNSNTYHPVVRYRTAAGLDVTFRSSHGSSPPSHAVGEAVEVLYDESDPSAARIRSFASLWLGPIIVGGIGSVFVLVGGGVIYWRRRAAELAQYLRRHGTPVQTEFQNAEINTQLRVNGRHPWRIVTQWKTRAPASCISSAAKISGLIPPATSPPSRSSCISTARTRSVTTWICRSCPSWRTDVPAGSPWRAPVKSRTTSGTFTDDGYVAQRRSRGHG
jgi:hypothetical protein